MKVKNEEAKFAKAKGKGQTKGNELDRYSMRIVEAAGESKKNRAKNHAAASENSD